MTITPSLLYRSSLWLFVYHRFLYFIKLCSPSFRWPHPIEEKNVWLSVEHLAMGKNPYLLECEESVLRHLWLPEINVAQNFCSFKSSHIQANKWDGKSFVILTAKHTWGAFFVLEQQDLWNCHLLWKNNHRRSMRPLGKHSEAINMWVQRNHPSRANMCLSPHPDLANRVLWEGHDITAYKRNGREAMKSILAASFSDRRQTDNFVSGEFPIIELCCLSPFFSSERKSNMGERGYWGKS